VQHGCGTLGGVSEIRTARASKRRWLIGIALVAGAYAAHTSVALLRSAAQLGMGRGTAPARVVVRHGAPTSERTHPGAASTTGRDASSQRAPTAMAPSEAPLEPPEEGMHELRRRALLDAAARPDFAELMSSPDPEVRRAVLAFFESD
jgi:hypothetical protein